MNGSECRAGSTLIDALLRGPLTNANVVKLIKRALSDGDFIVTGPDLPPQ